MTNRANNDPKDNMKGEEEDHEQATTSEHESDEEEKVNPALTSKWTPPKYPGTFINNTEFDRCKNAQFLDDIEDRIARSDAPVRDEDQQYWIRRLFRAIFSMANIVDKPCKNNKPCQAAHRLMVGHYPPSAVEKLCWELFEHCKISSMGISQVENHHKGVFELEESFDARMEKIIEACAKSKALCKQLLDPPFISRLADAPGHELRAKTMNKKINSERDLQNSLGRELLRLENGIQVYTYSDDIEGDEDEEEEDEKNDDEDWDLRKPSSSTKKKRQGTKEERLMNADYDEKKRITKSATPRKYRSQVLANLKQNISPAVVPRLNQQIAKARAKSVRTPSTGKKSNSSSSVRKTPSKFPGGVSGELDYKIIICDLLVISRNYANDFTLYDLRFYARTYNNALKDVTWVYDEITHNTGRHSGYNRFYFNRDKTEVTDHFARVLKHFEPLAMGRGDLHPDGSFNTGREDNSFYTVPNITQTKKALGLVQNPFGMPRWGAPDEDDEIPENHAHRPERPLNQPQMSVEQYRQYGSESINAFAHEHDNYARNHANFARDARNYTRQIDNMLYGQTPASNSPGLMGNNASPAQTFYRTPNGEYIVTSVERAQAMINAPVLPPPGLPVRHRYNGQEYDRQMANSIYPPLDQHPNHGLADYDPNVWDDDYNLPSIYSQQNPVSPAYQPSEAYFSNMGTQFPAPHTDAQLPHFAMGQGMHDANHHMYPQADVPYPTQEVPNVEQHYVAQRSMSVQSPTDDSNIDPQLRNLGADAMITGNESEQNNPSTENNIRSHAPSPTGSNMDMDF